MEMKTSKQKMKPKPISPLIPMKSNEDESNLGAIDRQLAELGLLAEDNDPVYGDAFEINEAPINSANRGDVGGRQAALGLESTKFTDDHGGACEKGENVKVMVRCRPINSNECGQVVEVHEEDKCVELSLANSSQSQQQVAEQRQFQFDAVFGPNSTNEQVYMKSVRQLVEFAFKGYNCTVFLYGQTGTGKTYTHSSLTLSSFAHLFSLIRDSNTQVRFLIRASYYELYNEEIRDLLSNNPKKPSLELRESKSRGVYVKDLTCYLVNNLADLEKLKRLGDRQRVTASTKMNEHSSRSHSIFSLTIETVDSNNDQLKPETKQQKVKAHATAREGSRTAASTRPPSSSQQRKQIAPGDRLQHQSNRLVSSAVVASSGRKPSSASASSLSSSSSSSTATAAAQKASTKKATTSAVRVGQLHLVDLAGSERQSKSGSSGARLKEASRINLSLTCLSLVIRALTDETSTHVPYRNSKLTRLLSSSLGGNSKTLLIACISPAKGNLDETLNTLRFASRTKRIKNTAKINEDAKDALLRKYRRQIEELRGKLREHQLQQQKQREGEGGGETQDYFEEDDMIDYDAIESSLNEDGRKSGVSQQQQQQIVSNSNTAATSELLQQLRLLKAKIMVGGENLLEKAEMHERLIEASRAELEEKRLEELRLKEKLAKKQKLIEQMSQTKGSLEGQVVSLDEKLKRVLLLYKRCKEEQRDLASEHQQLKESLLQTIRATSKEIKYADCIIEDFIPREYLDLINTYAQYDDESDEWQIKYIALGGNNIAQTKRITENNSSSIDDGFRAGAAILSSVPRSIAGNDTKEGNNNKNQRLSINLNRSDPYIRLKDLAMKQ